MRWRVSTLAVLFGLLPAVAMAAERPVVVELFTSEGCSSCPPADALLTDLAQKRGLLPLAFHVTYWNSLGWRDPFSSEAATARQAVYGERFGDGFYTPEMVVNGKTSFVGSDRDKAEAAIAAADDETAATISLSRQGGDVSISVGAGSGSGRVVLVGFDRQHRTRVGRGENSGRTLVESNIVRSIRTLGTWTGAALHLDTRAPAGEETAALLEAPDGKIIGAAR